MMTCARSTGSSREFTIGLGGYSKGLWKNTARMHKHQEECTVNDFDQADRSVWAKV